MSVLLREADGFEGFSLVLCLLDAHYESVAQLEDEGVVLPSRSTAQLRSSGSSAATAWLSETSRLTASPTSIPASSKYPATSRVKSLR